MSRIARRLGDVADRAGVGVLSKQRALRPAQDLYPLDVGQIRHAVDGARQIDVVHVLGHVRVEDRIGIADTADEVGLGQGRDPAALDQHARDLSGEVAGGNQVLRCDLTCADDRHRNGSLLHLGRLARGGHHHVRQHRAGRGRSRPAGRGGRDLGGSLGRRAFRGCGDLRRAGLAGGEREGDESRACARDEAQLYFAHSVVPDRSFVAARTIGLR